MSISASDVKKLRDMTGAGMMDAKEALKECNSDFDEAVIYSVSYTHLTLPTKA